MRIGGSRSVRVVCRVPPDMCAFPAAVATDSRRKSMPYRGSLCVVRAIALRKPGGRIPQRRTSVLTIARLPRALGAVSDLRRAGRSARCAGNHDVRDDQAWSALRIAVRWRVSECADSGRDDYMHGCLSRFEPARIYRRVVMFTRKSMKSSARRVATRLRPMPLLIAGWRAKRARLPARRLRCEWLRRPGGRGWPGTGGPHRGRVAGIRRLAAVQASFG